MRRLCAGKVFDRMSKGIREAPGKALIGDLASESGDRTEGAFGKSCSPQTLLFPTKIAVEACNFSPSVLQLLAIADTEILPLYSHGSVYN